FGPVSPASWGPPPGGPHRVLWHGNGTGNPHGEQVDPALLAITVEEVLDAVRELTEDRPPVPPSVTPAPAPASSQPFSSQPVSSQPFSSANQP
ncbi:MAG: hypothetical protein QOE53_973, partial [Pseudonocardiales bacterium]|nr:hypothetical protein [Pseudonocardiales bacterium]